MWKRYLAVTQALGLVRNIVVVSMIPMKSDELYTERANIIILSTTCTPFWWPVMVGSDIANIERKLRGLKTKPFIPFLHE